MRPHHNKHMKLVIAHTQISHTTIATCGSAARAMAAGAGAAGYAAPHYRCTEPRRQGWRNKNKINKYLCTVKQRSATTAAEQKSSLAARSSHLLPITTGMSPRSAHPALLRDPVRIADRCTWWSRRRSRRRSTIGSTCRRDPSHCRSRWQRQ